MLTHYIKIAFRNLWKYKSQSAISIVGLAVGFTCFALSALWIRHEMSYDAFHPDNDRIYLIRQIDNITSFYTQGAEGHRVPDALPDYLRTHFTEIESVTSFYYLPGEQTVDVTVGENVFPALSISIDSAFLQLFGIQTLSGDVQELLRTERTYAITEKTAKKMFGDVDPVGKHITILGKERPIVAMIKDFPGPTNFPFDFLAGNHREKENRWDVASDVAFIKLHPNVNLTEFKEKIRNIAAQYSYEIIPIASVREKHSFYDPEVKHHHIYLFVVSGLLLIACCLFNYITLFLSRFRIRKREFAIRLVNGSSYRSLFFLLFTEFFMLLLLACIISQLLINACLLPFQALSHVEPTASVYTETILYIGGMIFLSVFLFSATLFFFRKQVLQASIRKNNHLGRKLSIVMQLVISVGFIFCTSVMMRQLWFLHHTDIGFNYKNIAHIRMYPSPDISEWESQAMKIPGITQAVAGFHPLFPPFAKMSIAVQTVDSPDESPTILEIFEVNETLCKLYGFQLLAGALIDDADQESNHLFTEAAAKLYGIDTPEDPVKGIIKDIHNSLPTIPPKPMMLRNTFESMGKSYHLIFSYEEGAWPAVKQRIEEWAKESHPDKHYEIVNGQETYNDYFRSEEALLKIVSFISLVCIIISLFGFVSIIALSCEEKRKEIAIRKVNGATVKDILSLFFKEYALLLLIGISIAFPVGYAVMRRWIDHYTLQASIPVWLYLVIVLALALIIITSIGWRIYQASRENPAEVMKN